MLFGPKKILGVYLSCPVWRPKSIRCSKWLVFAILEDQFFSWKTLHAIYRRLAWALNILFVGLMPAKDLRWEFNVPFQMWTGAIPYEQENQICIDRNQRRLGISQAALQVEVFMEGWIPFKWMSGGCLIVGPRDQCYQVSGFINITSSRRGLCRNRWSSARLQESWFQSTARSIANVSLRRTAKDDWWSRQPFCVR